MLLKQAKYMKRDIRLLLADELEEPKGRIKIFHQRIRQLKDGTLKSLFIKRLK